MTTLKILFNPRRRWKSNIHPYYRWKKYLKENGIKIELYFDHKDKRLRNSENILIHSRYFSRGWQSLSSRTEQNETELIKFLLELKKDTGRIIWYDEGDSTGSSDFPIIPYVDVFAKKQTLKDKSYYTIQSDSNDLRIWLNKQSADKHTVIFQPCPSDQLYKIKTAWNLAVVDYRYYPKRLNRLSNYINYKIYPIKIAPVNQQRPLDLIFRGTIKYTDSSRVSEQRNKVLELLQRMDINASIGAPISKFKYLKELYTTKVSVSPFGFGEVCYRDFETFLAGSLLIKPSMEHLETYPDAYKPYETYIPVSWDLTDLREKLEDCLVHYDKYIEIAENGQQRFVNTINNPEFFLSRIKEIIE